MNTSFHNTLKVVHKNTKGTQLSILKVVYNKASQRILKIV